MDSAAQFPQPASRSLASEEEESHPSREKAEEKKRIANSISSSNTFACTFHGVRS